MKVWKYFAVTALTITMVVVMSSTGITVRNFYAHAGILSPVGSTPYAIPFANNMTVSVGNVIVLLCMGLSVAIITDLMGQLLYTWEGGTTNPSEYSTGTPPENGDDKGNTAPPSDRGAKKPPPQREDSPAGKNRPTPPERKATPPRADAQQRKD